MKPASISPPVAGRPILTPSNSGPRSLAWLFRRRLAQAPNLVWGALTEARQHEKWAPGVQIDARVGAAVLFDFDDRGKAEDEIVACESPRLLAHTWLWADEPVSTVRWELEADGSDATLLVLLHGPVSSRQAAGYATGWHVMLDALRLHLSGDGISGWTPDWAGLSTLYGNA